MSLTNWVFTLFFCWTFSQTHGVHYQLSQNHIIKRLHFLPPFLLKPFLLLSPWKNIIYIYTYFLFFWAIVVVVALLCVVANLECVKAASYTVGGARGWRFNVNNWPKGKRFRAGGVLGMFLANQTDFQMAKLKRPIPCALKFLFQVLRNS